MCHDGGRCIEKRYVCDGKMHCKYGSDEKFCGLWNCTKGFWKCSDNKCITLTNVCNQGRQCSDGSDEDKYLCDKWNCARDRLKCDSFCIPHKFVCDGRRYVGCKGKDEDPDMCQQWKCSKENWKCGNGQCIERRKVCDGDSGTFSNCLDRTDEDPQLCASWNCEEEYWKCKDNLTCIPLM